MSQGSRDLWQRNVDVRQARFSPDARRLALRTADEQVVVYSARTGRRLSSGLPSGTTVRGFAFGPGGSITYVVPHGRGSAAGIDSEVAERVDLLECSGDVPACSRAGTVNGQVTLPQ